MTFFVATTNVKSMQTLVDDARFPLNDAAKVSWSDANLLSYANGAINLLKLKRPDIFFGRWRNMPKNLQLTDDFPIDETYYEPVADYMRAKAHFADDEKAVQGAAGEFFKLFTASSS